MTQKRVKLIDIAKELNVSVGLVSLVLGGKAKENRISDAISEKVLQKANEMGYQAACFVGLQFWGIYSRLSFRGIFPGGCIATDKGPGRFDSANPSRSHVKRPVTRGRVKITDG